MKKILKRSFTLFLMAAFIFALTACGLAEPTTPTENPDTQNPVVINSDPLNDTELGYIGDPINLILAIEKISLTINEAIEPTSLTVLNTLEFKSETSVLKGEWTFNSETNILAFNLDPSNRPVQEQTFTMAINGEATDLAGNPLIWNLKYRTPDLFNVVFTASGLTDGDSVEITQTLQNSNEEGSKIVIDANGEIFILDANLTSRDIYYLAISKPAKNNFCALSNTNGQVNNSDIIISINCHNVKPVNPTAYNWNQYYLNDEPKWVHGGELRMASFPEFQSCEGITVEDLLGAFDWTCVEEVVDNIPQIKVISTNLKLTANLRDLIEIETVVRWKENSIKILRNGQQIAESDRGMWWTNPIVIATSTKLTGNGVIYFIEGQSLLNQSFSLSDNKGISLLTKPGDIMLPASFNAGISVNRNTTDPVIPGVYGGTWIEGNINASSSAIGISLKGVSFVTINNTSVINSKGNGIEINNTFSTRITNIQTSKNAGDGIYASNSQTRNYNSMQNIISTNNVLSGINLAGTDTTLINANSANNNEHGVVITGNNNKIINLSSSNNRLDGLIISGGSNNIINASTSSSNGNNGIRFSKSGGVNSARNNLLSNVSITNNFASGINFEDTNENNSLINLLDTYNAASNCPDTSCDNVTVVTIDDIATTDLFSPIYKESNIPNYQPDSSLHISQAIKFAVFDNQYRAWGNEILATTEAGGGTCNDESTNNLCLLFDWTLNTSDETIARNQHSAMNSTDEHTFFDSDPIFFLSNAIEILGDRIGNDNSLCEIDEDCLLTPNIGSYQGHGSMTKLSDVNDLNATLYQFDINGRNEQP